MVADDVDHERCAPYSQPSPERRVVPAPVLAELDHLLSRELGADAFPKLLDTIKAGELDVGDLTASDYNRGLSDESGPPTDARATRQGTP
jgi:hypothetical protein